MTAVVNNLIRRAPAKAPNQGRTRIGYGMYQDATGNRYNNTGGMIQRATTTAARPGTMTTPGTIGKTLNPNQQMIPKAPARVYDTKDPEYGRYHKEWSNPNTPQARKDAINKVWKFGATTPDLTDAHTLPLNRDTATEPAYAMSPESMRQLTDILFPVDDGMVRYEQDKKEGETLLARKLRSLGLSDSGAAIEASNKLESALLANRDDRLARSKQLNADRFTQLNENESQRLERGANRQSDDLFRAIELALSQSPLGPGASAAEKLAYLQTEQGQSLANKTAQLFNKTISSGGGGVGPYIPPPPSAPDRTQSGQLGIVVGAENDNQRSNFLSNLFGRWFK